MHNPCHSEINKETVLIPWWGIADPFTALKRRIKTCSLKRFRRTVLTSLDYLLSTLAVSCIFLGGAYLFLVQLAHYGW